MKRISLVFVSNYFNHHQKYLSDCFFQRLGDQYHFIETMPMEEERISMGWETFDEKYLLKSYVSDEEAERAQKLINTADVVIFGSANEKLIRRRLNSKKIIFRYSERVFKEKKFYWLKLPFRLFRFRRWNPKSARIYLLCSSAFSSLDYQKGLGLFWGKCLKWGYFTEAKVFDDLQSLVDGKDFTTILWCGRLVEGKRLKDVLMAFEIIQKKYSQMRLRVIGGGPLEKEYKEYVAEHGIKNVSFTGSLDPETVRTEMERSGFFVFSSSFEEGWGAVVNEAMNSACAVIAGHAAGSVPFLIKNQENGFVFESGNVQSLAETLMSAIQFVSKSKKVCANAYSTIVNLWSPVVAADRFLEVCKAAMEGGNPTVLFKEGPCSQADIIEEDWFSHYDD